MKEAAKKIGADRVFLGMHDIFRMNDWVDVFNQPLRGRYTNWCVDTPKRPVRSTQRCGAYWVLHNGWGENVCDEQHEFMCEIEVE